MKLQTDSLKNSAVICKTQTGEVEKIPNYYYRPLLQLLLSEFCREKQNHVNDAASGWAGWAFAHPVFGSSVKPILTKGGRLCPPHYYLPFQIFRPSYTPPVGSCPDEA